MTLATVRFLRTEDYGLMAVTMAITGFLQSMSYVGFADAIVQTRRLLRMICAASSASFC